LVGIPIFWFDVTLRTFNPFFIESSSKQTKINNNTKIKKKR
jgi:hypothetical protein